MGWEKGKLRAQSYYMIGSLAPKTHAIYYCATLKTNGNDFVENLHENPGRGLVEVIIVVGFITRSK
jgi:hypothetical protein